MASKAHALHAPLSGHKPTAANWLFSVGTLIHVTTDSQCMCQLLILIKCTNITMQLFIGVDVNGGPLSMQPMSA